MHRLTVRTIFWIVVIISLVALMIPNFQTVKAMAYSSPCEVPVRYRIDEVDPRFELTEEQFLNDISRAETLWEEASPYNLFEYDPQGELSINLVYDERQGLTNQINDLEGDLDEGQKNLQAQQAEYDRLETAFRARLQAFNSEVNAYNSQGGAPFAEYDRLLKEQEELEQESRRLNELARKLNREVVSYNQQVNQLNTTVNNFSEALTQRPEEGIYLGEENRIEIYFVISKDELVHTIAHELGHSLGIDHNQDPKGIMYEYTTDNVALSAADSGDLTVACRKLTFFDRLGNNLNYLAQKYLQEKN